MRHVRAGALELRRQPLLLAAGLWVGVQGLVCLAALPEASYPWLALASSLGAAAGLWALVVVPGRSAAGPLGGTLAPAPAAAAAVLLPLAVLANAFAVAPGSSFGDRPTAPGLLSPALALLVVRDRPALAHASALTTLAVLTGLRHWAGEGPLWAPETAMLLGPVLVWWAWGLVAARLVQTTQIDLLRSDSAYALARERRRRTRERAEAHERRRALLEVAAVPLLEEVARAAGPLDPDVRDQLTAVEKDLRAELRGRDLLDPEVRRCAAGARRRGVRVDVVDHAPPSADLELLPSLRALVAAALHSCSDGEITARRPPSGPVLTLVHVGSPRSVRAVDAAVAAHRERLTGAAVAGFDVSVDEDSVVVEVGR
ncbi:hypothetical protein FHN55_20965 [Streptomyces sp. NP160]|uniref:hypothetical protein n=1 Tax=Streptomyces sp. NP160 TaxID=2586637 RepID=UPI00111BB423|nr:hypothetical protein [Streptomyces sp. NP160]TNM59499.1 hypothetical protein FHN55_20965 [Streptomyces sp. NP160]